MTLPRPPCPLSSKKKMFEEMTLPLKVSINVIDKFIPSDSITSLTFDSITSLTKYSI
jgi:hypothetical protein